MHRPIGDRMTISCRYIHTGQFWSASLPKTTQCRFWMTRQAAPSTSTPFQHSCSMHHSNGVKRTLTRLQCLRPKVTVRRAVVTSSSCFYDTFSKSTSANGIELTKLACVLHLLVVQIDTEHSYQAKHKTL